MGRAFRRAMARRRRNSSSLSFWLRGEKEPLPVLTPAERTDIIRPERPECLSFVVVVGGFIIVCWDSPIPQSEGTFEEARFGDISPRRPMGPTKRVLWQLPRGNVWKQSPVPFLWSKNLLG